MLVPNTPYKRFPLIPEIKNVHEVNDYNKRHLTMKKSVAVNLKLSGRHRRVSIENIIGSFDTNNFQALMFAIDNTAQNKRLSTGNWFLQMDEYADQTYQCSRVVEVETEPAFC